MILDWLDAIHRGYGFAGIGNLQGNGAATLFGVQLFNPTQKSSKIPVTAFIKALTIWSTDSAFVQFNFFRGQLSTAIQSGTNLLGEDFPTTGNGVSVCNIRGEISPAAIPANYLWQAHLKAGDSISVPWEWLCRLAPGDPANGWNNTSLTVTWNADTGVALPVAHYWGVGLSWIELPSGML